MFKSKTVLSQLQSFISGYEFKKGISEYNGGKGVRNFKSRNLLNVMLYVQIAASNTSVYDIKECLAA